MTTEKQEPPEVPPIQLQAWALDKDGKVRTGVFATHALACQWASTHGLGEPATKRLESVLVKEVNEIVKDGNEAN